MDQIDQIPISEEAQELIDSFNKPMSLRELREWYFKKHVAIGSGFVIDFLMDQKRESLNK